jgi:N,N-dimethylformamidase
MRGARIVGYADQLSVQPGADLAVKVDTQAPAFHVDVIRVRHGDTNPAGPGPRSELVAADIGDALPGRPQPLRTGSRVEVADAGGLLDGDAFTICAWVYPTLPDRGRQGLVTRYGDGGGAGLFMGRDGRAELAVTAADGTTATLRAGAPLQSRTWHFVAAAFDARSGDAWLVVEPTGPWSGAPERCEAVLDVAAPSPSDAPLLIAAAMVDDGSLRVAGEHFDGKIDAPAVWDRMLQEHELAQARGATAGRAVCGATAAWDFSQEISGRAVPDTGPANRHGRAVNQPARGVTGHSWDGAETDWRRAPEQYAAIHFHSDDLDDAEWSTDLTWTVPDDLRSGVYAFRLRADDGDDVDHVPFFVRPRQGTTTARIALLLPTFTYLAYGNEQQLGRDEIRKVFEGLGSDFTYPLQPADRYMVDHALLSLYDRHRDGSGVAYSSRLRPILSMRPDYRFPYVMQGVGGPHGLGADLHTVDWLEHEGYEFDVLTDEDLHHEGADLLRPYRVVISGSHHEYATAPMQRAIDGYLHDGGRLMYLSGNGLYWVTGVEPDGGHTIEIRRCGASSRTWEAEPGEWHLSTTGELGGLWRFRARAPQAVVGVGMSAEGLGPGCGYHRNPDSHDPRAKFIFEGIGDDERIGDFPNLVVGYGAAGWEIDRHDAALGSPPHALVVATADTFADDYQHVVDEVMHADSRQSASVNPFVRSDIVFYEGPKGGAVFSAGSIAWCGSLSYNGYDNTVARVTGNVLERFASDEPFELPG